MGSKWWFLAPLYWLLAALPLMAALWVYLQIPGVVQITPDYSVETGRGGIFALPALNACLAVLLHVGAGRIGRNLELRFRELEKQSDAPQVIPALKLFTMASNSRRL